MEKIGILCSGGDSPGMNACLKAIVNTCTSHGIIPIGIRRGYQGLIENDMIFLDNRMVENTEWLGGTIIKVSRSAEFRTPEGINKAVRNLQKNGIEGLIVMGGNGSFNGVVNLANKGVKVIGIPGTIDNDLFYTERSLGFDTAVNNAIKSVDSIMQSISSNKRGMIVEVMGRHCGDIALYTALGCSAHALATKEMGTELQDIVDDVRVCMASGIVSPLVIMSENVDYNVKDVERVLQQQLNIETRSTELGYIQRGGAPSFSDRIMAIQFGVLAVNLLQEDVSGVALGIKDDKVMYEDITTCLSKPQKFNFDFVQMLRDLHNLDNSTKV